MEWLLRRIGQAIITIAIALLVLFILPRLVPGDPLASIDDERPLSREQVERERERYGLDRPMGAQLASYVSGLVRGDLGTSIQFGRPVGQMVRERLPATLLLGGSVLLINFTIGLWLGVLQARHQGKWPDRALTFASLTLYAMPSFWLGLMLILAFGLHLHWLPVSGIQDPTLAGSSLFATLGDRFRHLVLPVATLSLVTIAASMRYQRAAMLEVLAQPYITSARARGLGETRVIWGHAWRSALSPVLTLFGLWLPIVVVGSVFVEQVFAWPGLGSLAAAAAGARDYPLVMGTALLATTAIVVGNLLSDAVLAFLDPRVRHA